MCDRLCCDRHHQHQDQGAHLQVQEDHIDLLDGVGTGATPVERPRLSIWCHMSQIRRHHYIDDIVDNQEIVLNLKI